MKNHKLIIILIAVLAGVLALMVFTKKPNSNSTDQLKVVTSIRVYQEPLQKILGNKGTAYALINKQSVDPHDFEPSTNDAKTVDNANLVVANGLGYDPFMNRLAKNSKAAFIDLGTDVLKLKNGANPHIWFKTDIMQKIVPELTKKIVAIDPKNKDYYQANADKYLVSLSDLAEIKGKVTAKVQTMTNRDVFVSEPVFDYALNDFGLTIKNKSFEESIEKETDPSAEDLSAMQNDLKNKKVSLFVLNTQVTSKLITNLTKDAKAGKVNIFEVTETMPNDLTYHSWMEKLYNNFITLI